MFSELKHYYSSDTPETKNFKKSHMYGNILLNSNMNSESKMSSEKNKLNTTELQAIGWLLSRFNATVQLDPLSEVCACTCVSWPRPRALFQFGGNVFLISSFVDIKNVLFWMTFVSYTMLFGWLLRDMCSLACSSGSETASIFCPFSCCSIKV